MKKLILVPFALLLCANQSVQQFDLSCNVFETSGYFDSPVQSPVRIELIIDLEKMEYCEANCSKVLPIEKVMSDKIILRDYLHVDRLVTVHISAVIDRVAGTYTYIFDDKSNFKTKRHTAECKRLPFSGFPSIKF